MRKSLVLGLSTAVCALLVFLLWSGGSQPSHEEEEHEHHHDFVHFDMQQLDKHGISIQAASPGKLQTTIRAPAKIIIAYDQIAHVLPKVSGIALKAYKNLGEKVGGNQILALLESKEMAEIKAGYLTALQKAQLTENNYQREKTLFEKNISAAQEFNTTKNTWEAAVIELELAKQKLSALGLKDREIEQLPSMPAGDLRHYALRSPIAGEIISRHITIGELVNENQEVYVVADLEKVWAEINIFSQDRQYVRQGQPVRLISNDGQITEGTVVFLSPVIDEQSRTSKAIAEINNYERDWLPGSFAQAELTTGEMQVGIAIPKEAIQNVEGENAVFIQNEEGFAVKPVVLGGADDRYYEVVEGLVEGDLIASHNTFLLKAELQKDEAEHMD